MPRAPIALFHGEDPYLLREAALAFLEPSGARATEVDGAEWAAGTSSDLATPSLFGEPRALLVTNAQALAEAGLRELTAYLDAPSPDATLAMTLVTRARNPTPLMKSVSAAGGTVKAVALRRQDLAPWLVERAARRGVRLSTAGGAALVDVLGEDTAQLDRAVEQLGDAFPGLSIGPEQVQAQFRGLGEQRVWDLCDQAFAGREADALVTLRALLAGREDPLLIVGGIASRLRDLIRVRALPDRTPPAEVAKAAGLRFDWQARRYRDQARRFSPEDLERLHARVVESDRLIKGGVPEDVVLGTLVAAMSGRLEVELDPGIRVGR
jgi:DNA polymerase-3 subunit delta